MKMTERLKINSRPETDEQPYMHLYPIVEELIKEGNIPIHEGVFYKDRDGWRCDLKKPINFDLIKIKFILPASIYLSEANDSILCRESWIEIMGSCNFNLY